MTTLVRELLCFQVGLVVFIFSHRPVTGKLQDVLYNSVELRNYNQTNIKPVFRIPGTLQRSIMEKLLHQYNRSQKRFQFIAKCGISGNWRKVAYFDTSKGDLCPSGLRTVTNNSTQQRACGRTLIGSRCTSIPIPVQDSYTKVCGIVKGYQEDSTDGFRGSDGLSVDDSYVDGISITQGSPRRYLWTYVSGLGELAPIQQERCPCARSNPSDRTGVPSFVGEHFYCESGFSVSFMYGVIAWDDPLWDGANCQAPSNKCCERYGWFYRDIPLSSNDIELRTCADEGYENEDTLIAGYEFWVI